MDFTIKEQYDYQDLLTITEILRAPGGCPWDREQDHHSVRKNLIEEAYEAAEAIDNDDAPALCEELGDVLLQVAFHAQMEKEAGGFTMEQVVDGVCKKLVYRHPHVFGDVAVSGSEQVLSNWDKLKEKEKGQKSASETMLAVAKSLPALMRAQKIQAKAAKVGFDWERVDGALDKTREELAETQSALAGQGDIQEEIGDLLFSVVNIARFAHVDAEEALERANEKFLNRFAFVEEQVAKSGREWSSFTVKELDEFWNLKKTLEK